jgi:hypothetical protein
LGLTALLAILKVMSLRALSTFAVFFSTVAPLRAVILYGIGSATANDMATL